MAQLLRLLNSKCPYCHHLKVNAGKKHRVYCKLRLLALGLVDQSDEIDNLTTRNQKQKMKAQEMGQNPKATGDQGYHAGDEEHVEVRLQDEEESVQEEEETTDEEEGDELRRVREEFLKAAIKLHRAKPRQERKNPGKIETSSSKRRELIKELLKMASDAQNCGNCKGQAHLHPAGYVDQLIVFQSMSKVSEEWVQQDFLKAIVKRWQEEIG